MNGYNLSEIEWINEKAENIPGHKFMYFLIRLLTLSLRKKLTYKELFLVYYGIHREKIGDMEAKKLAFERIKQVYEDNKKEKRRREHDV